MLVSAIDIKKKHREKGKNVAAKERQIRIFSGLRATFDHNGCVPRT